MKIGVKILIPMVMISFASLTLVGGASYFYMKEEVDKTNKTQIDAAISMLEDEMKIADSMTTLVLGEMDQKNLSLARALAEIVRQNPEETMTTEEMTRIAKMLDVDEVHVTDDKGVLNWGNRTDFYGFDFATTDQTLPFMEILKDTTMEIAQEPQPNGTHGAMFQYIGVARTDAPGVVQVGNSANVVNELKALLDVQNKTELMRIGQTGFPMVVQGGVITAHKDPAQVGVSVANEAWFKQLASGSGYDWVDMNGARYLAGYKQAGDSMLIGMISHEEYSAGLDKIRNISIFMIALSSLATIAILFVCVQRMVVRPIRHVSGVMAKVAEGQLGLSIEQNYTGEFGDLKQAINRTIATMSDYVGEIDCVLGRFADGFYDQEVTSTFHGDFAPIGEGMHKISDRMNLLISNIRTASEQVSSGSAQIAGSAQSLSSGSSQQSATVEQFTDSIVQIQKQAGETSKVATATYEDTKQVGVMMNDAMQSMQQMKQAMQTITANSQDIVRVIKTIDDVAFQTNILALNAAVEAARAGVHGKGFAVVADEVRNLATKSAEAANETTALIKRSIESVKQGDGIVENAGANLDKAADIAAANAEEMRELSDVFDQQHQAITEITQNISQISSVVHANSTTAQELAASSEEMAAQSAVLNQVVSTFRLRDGQNKHESSPRQQQSGFSLFDA